MINGALAYLETMMKMVPRETKKGAFDGCNDSENPAHGARRVLPAHNDVSVIGDDVRPRGLCHVATGLDTLRHSGVFRDRHLFPRNDA